MKHIRILESDTGNIVYSKNIGHSIIKKKNVSRTNKLLIYHCKLLTHRSNVPFTVTAIYLMSWSECMYLYITHLKDRQVQNHLLILYVGLGWMERVKLKRKELDVGGKTWKQKMSSCKFSTKRFGLKMSMMESGAFFHSEL